MATDILFINVPQISLVYPPAATSLLKGICEDHGFTARVLDFNLDLYTTCTDDSIKTELDQHFSLNDHDAELTKTTRDYLEQYYVKVIAEILKLNPKWLGISVFTFQCQIFTKELLIRLKDQYKGKVIVGGAGLSTNGISAKQNDFGSFLLDNKLVDHYIRGEGERVIIDLLKGSTDLPGLDNDNFEQINELDKLPYPNYDDVIGLGYKYTTGTPQIPVTGSRGCVRKCSFCDIHTAWRKYRYRSGKNMAEEFIYHYEKYGVTNFWFTDSLINGAMASFREFCQELVNYYKANGLPDRTFNWGGQFIVRDRKSMPPRDFEMASRAGMNGVAMGVESLSESVRDHMKKGFNDSDLDYTLSEIHRNNMNCYFLMIVGYPSETLADFEQGLDKFREYKKYALDGTIYGVNLGTTASIDEGTPLYDDIHREGMDARGYDWILPNNPDLDIMERIRRRIIMQEVLMDLGYKIWNGDSQLLKLKEAYGKIKNRKYKTKIKLQVPE